MLSLINSKYYQVRQNSYIRCSLNDPDVCPDGYTIIRFLHYQHLCLKIHKFTAQPDELSDTQVKQHICDNIFYINSDEALAVFQQLSLEQHLIETDRCLFAIIQNKVIIKESSWSGDFPFKTFHNSPSDHLITQSPNRILVTQNDGIWIWSDDPVTCAICSISSKCSSPSLELTKDDNGHLVVTVRNYISLQKENESSNEVSCVYHAFTSNSDQNILLVPLASSSDNDKKFRLSTISNGKYRCISEEINTHRRIETEIILENPFEFAIFARSTIHLYPSTTNPTTEEHTDPIQSPRPTATMKTTSNIPFAYFRTQSSIAGQFQTFLANQLDNQPLHVDGTLLKQSTTFVHLFHVTISVTTDDFLTFENNSINLTRRMLAAYYIKEKLNEIRQMTDPDFQILSLNSTEFCLPTSISKLNTLNTLNWPGGRIGQYAISNEFCLLRMNGLPATRLCIGGYLYGGVWMELPDEIKCDNETQTEATFSLFKVTRLHLSSDGMTGTITKLDEIVSQTDPSSLIAADIFYLSHIIQDIQYHTAAEHLLDYGQVNCILRAYNWLLMVTDTTLFSTVAREFNATNVLLHALDEIIISFTRSTSKTADHTLTKSGILSFQFPAPMLSTVIFNPRLTNFTGMVVTTTNRTTDIIIEYLPMNGTVTDIMEITNLLIASYVPTSLLKQLNNTFIIMTMFVNDVLFQAFNPTTLLSDTPHKYLSSSGLIISVTLPGVKGNLPETLPIFITPTRQNENIVGDNVCGYWNFSHIIGGWTTEGCLPNHNLTNGVTVLCECKHLTNFACLFNGNTPIITAIHSDRLQLLTFILCSSSLAGLIGIFASAIVFKSWRTKFSTKFLLQLSTALTLELLMILFVNTEANSWNLITTDHLLGCIALGAILHYTVLVNFLWMSIIAYAQLMRYVFVFHQLNSNQFFITSSVIGWSTPLLPVVAVLLFDSKSYVPSYGVNTICYPSGYGLYFALMTPVAASVFVNIIIFVAIIWKLSKENCPIQRNYNRTIMLSKLRLSIFLFFLLGLTWIFVFMSTMAKAGIIFTYLFCVTATLQGLALFFYFIVLDPVARKLWLNLCKRFCCRRAIME